MRTAFRGCARWCRGLLARPARHARRSSASTDLAAAVAERSRRRAPPLAVAVHRRASIPALLAAGVRVERCHDLELDRGVCCSGTPAAGASRARLAAAWARLTGAPDAARPAAARRRAARRRRRARSSTTLAPGRRRHRRRSRRSSRCTPTSAPAIAARWRSRARFRLLVAAESAGALIAAEMGHAGLPWRADVHDALLVELLGAPSAGGRSAAPARRAGRGRINEAFGVPGCTPTRPPRCCARSPGPASTCRNTRPWVLRTVDHPAVPLLLEYKELYRIWTAHGWAWLDSWVHDGRFRAEYVPGGVVSGRWATRGGGALQIPKVVRRAVVADPGWRFVVADAGQLEPRVLAAVSGDDRLAAAGAAGDLYAALAADAFGGDRAKAKVALLGAMYGQTGGDAAPALATLRRNYPTAFDYVEAAARTGEAGGLVRSWLGRTCPPPSASLSFAADGAPPERAGPAARARGRFTRNFVIQATAAEWALTLLASLRPRLTGDAELVFFQHDEVRRALPRRAGRRGGGRGARGGRAGPPAAVRPDPGALPTRHRRSWSATPTRNRLSLVVAKGEVAIWAGSRDCCWRPAGAGASAVRRRCCGSVTHCWSTGRSTCSGRPAPRRWSWCSARSPTRCRSRPGWTRRPWW